MNGFCSIEFVRSFNESGLSYDLFVYNGLCKSVRCTCEFNAEVLLKLCCRSKWYVGGP